MLSTLLIMLVRSNLMRLRGDLCVCAKQTFYFRFRQHGFMKMEPDSINGENEHPCSAAKRPRRDRSVSRGSRGRHDSGGSYSDSVSSLEEYELPSSTSYWDTHVLDDLGISYMEDYLSSPLDVLGMIYTETGLFGPLSDEQKELVKLLQNNIVYSHSVSDLFQRTRGMDTLLDMHREMVKNITDIENNQNIR